MPALNTKNRRSRSARPGLEDLEGRQVLSAVVPLATGNVSKIAPAAVKPAATPLYSVVVNIKNEVNHDVHVVLGTTSSRNRVTFDFILKPGQTKTVRYQSEFYLTGFATNRTDSTKTYHFSEGPEKSIRDTGKWYFNVFVKPAGSDKTYLKVDLYPA